MGSNSVNGNEEMSRIRSNTITSSEKLTLIYLAFTASSAPLSAPDASSLFGFDAPVHTAPPAQVRCNVVENE